MFDDDEDLYIVHCPYCRTKIDLRNGNFDFCQHVEYAFSTASCEILCVDERLIDAAAEALIANPDLDKEFANNVKWHAKMEEREDFNKIAEEHAREYLLNNGISAEKMDELLGDYPQGNGRELIEATDDPYLGGGTSIIFCSQKKRKAKKTAKKSKE